MSIAIFNKYRRKPFMGIELRKDWCSICKRLIEGCSACHKNEHKQKRASR